MTEREKTLCDTISALLAQGCCIWANEFPIQHKAPECGWCTAVEQAEKILAQIDAAEGAEHQPVSTL